MQGDTRVLLTDLHQTGIFFQMLPSYSFLAGQQGRNLSHSEVTLSALQKTQLGENSALFLTL